MNIAHWSYLFYLANANTHYDAYNNTITIKPKNSKTREILITKPEQVNLIKTILFTGGYKSA